MYQYKPDLVIFLACTCNIYFYYLMPVFQVIVSEKAYYISSISNHIDHAILKSEDENFLKWLFFKKIRKSLLFSKSKLLLSINNQNINLTKWNQSILVAVLIILGFRISKHGVTIIQTGQLLVLQGSEMVMTSEKKSLGIKIE